ncbi:MAG: hypothetical protein CMJ52_03885 [Planctomycetaceae bacterium]|nr:hypothetical protein [Planctomycetaceae bacterium]
MRLEILGGGRRQARLAGVGVRELAGWNVGTVRTRPGSTISPQVWCGDLIRREIGTRFDEGE